MCRRPSSCHFLLLLLIVAAGLVAGQDEEEEIASAEAEVEAEVDEEESAPEETTTADEPDGQLTAEQCEHPTKLIKTKCCKMMLDMDDAFVKCFMLHQKKMPKKNDENPIALVNFFSCLIECIYKSKKYMTKDEKVNMKMVRADAKKLYKNKPKERDFYIAQYEHCERHAGLEWGKLKKNPAAKALFAAACKPYYLFVFLCIVDYGKISCPHFKWSNTKEFKEECESLKAKCYAIVG